MLFCLEYALWLWCPSWLSMPLVYCVLETSYWMPYFMGSINMRLPSFSYMTIMYLFPWLETTGNIPVLSMYIIFLMLLVVKLTSLHLCCGLWTTRVSWGLPLTCIDHTTCCHKWLFSIYDDSAYCLLTALVVIIGHIVKNPGLIVFIYIVFVGYPAAAWWYLMSCSRLGNSLHYSLCSVPALWCLVGWYVCKFCGWLLVEGMGFVKAQNPSLTTLGRWALWGLSSL